MDKRFKCPICGYEQFDENANFEAPVEEKEINEEKQATDVGNKNKLLPIVAILSFFALTNLITLFTNTMAYTGLAFDIIGLCALTILLVTFVMQMKNKSMPKYLKQVGFVLYAIAEFVGRITTMAMYEYFSFVNILFAIIYIAIIYLIVFRFEKWIKG